MTTANANLIARCQRDPALFLEHVLGWQPWSRQLDIALAVRDAIAGRGPKRIAVRSGNGVGKTAIAARIMLWALRCHKDSVVITTAPTTRQVTEILWREARDAYLAARLPLGGTFYDGQPRWDLGPRRFALGMSPENTRPERFQGFHASLIVFIVDEASGVPPAHWEAIKGSLLAGNAILLAIGNPTRLSGEFYDAFHKNAALWHPLHISAFHSPNLMHASSLSRPREADSIGPSDPIGARQSGGGAESSASPVRPEVELGERLEPRPNATSPADTPSPSMGEGGGDPIIPGLVTLEGVLQAAADWGEASPLYQVRILGQFPSQAGNQLISLEWIEQAASAERQHPGVSPERGEVPLWQRDTGDVPPSPPSTLAGGWVGTTSLVDAERQHKSPSPSMGEGWGGGDPDAPSLGVDVARSGADETAIALLIGNRLHSIETFRGQDTMKTVAAIQRYVQRYPAIAIAVDDGGVGGGVVDRLRELDIAVHAVKFGASPDGRSSVHFKNKLSEMYWTLREALRDGLLTLTEDRKLHAQLSQIEWEQESDRLIRVHKRGLRSDLPSPDRADALALAWEARLRSHRLPGLWLG